MREPVDHERVARLHAQVERLDRDALGAEVVALAAVLDRRRGAAHQRLEGAGPVLLRPEQEADQVRAGHGSANLPPGAREQLHEVRVERVAPADVVVRVAVDVQRDGVALAAQRGRDRAVVGEVLLGRAAGERDRDRRRGGTGAQHVPDEARDPAEAREAGLLAVPAQPEERARLEDQRAERARVEPARVQQGERAEAGAEAGDRGGGGELGEAGGQRCVA